MSVTSVRQEKWKGRERKWWKRGNWINREEETRDKVGRERLCWRTWWFLHKTNTHQLSLPRSRLTALKTMWGKGLKTQISPSLPLLAFLSLNSRSHPLAFPVCLSFFLYSWEISLPLLPLLLWRGHTDLADVWEGVKTERRRSLPKNKSQSEWKKEKDVCGIERKESSIIIFTQHMPPVCLEYKGLFLDTDGYFCICAGEEGGRKFILWLNPFFEMRIRQWNARAGMHICVCACARWC